MPVSGSSAIDMTRKIYKYPLIPIKDEQVIVADVCKAVHAGLDPTGVPCIWLDERPNSPYKSALKVYIIGTGNPIPDHVSVTGHVGSFCMGAFVWHVYV